MGFFGKTKCINAINVEWRGENLRNQKTWRVEMCVEGGFFFFKINKRYSTFIREMRVLEITLV